MDRYEVVEDVDADEALTPAAQVIQAARYADVPEADLRAVLAEAPHLVDAVDEQGRSPMHMAAANGHTEIIRVLISCGAVPNLQNAEGCTALHYASVNNQLEAARLLLDAKWVPWIRDRSGKTPISIISEKQFDDMETMLLMADTELDNYAPEGARIDVDEEGSDVDDGEVDAVVAATGPTQSASPPAAAPPACPPSAAAARAGPVSGSAAIDDIE